MSLRQSFQNPIFLTADQFSQIFNQPTRESQYVLDFQPENPRDMSFASPSNPLDASGACTGSFLTESVNLGTVEKEPAANNPNLLEAYQRLLRQNKELLTKRKELEEENAGLIEENFKLKRNAQELLQKLSLAQSNIQIRKDQEIQNLKNQIRQLQQKLGNEKERDSAPKSTQQSPSELSTANSTKAHSQILVGYSTHRVASNEQSRNPSRFTSPVAIKCFEGENQKLSLSTSNFNVHK